MSSVVALCVAIAAIALAILMIREGDTSNLAGEGHQRHRRGGMPKRFICANRAGYPPCFFCCPAIMKWV